MKTYSVASLLFLTTIVAIVSCVVERRLNPTDSDLFRTLLSKIPREGQSHFAPPVTNRQLESANHEISKRIANGHLPNSVKILYRHCGGQPWYTASHHELFPSFSLNPIDNAIRDYQETCELYESVIPHEKDVFPKTWYDYHLFPFGYSPGTGTLFCVDIRTEEIYNFNPDGGLMPLKYKSIKDLLRDSIEYQRQEYDR